MKGSVQVGISMQHASSNTLADESMEGFFDSMRHVCPSFLIRNTRDLNVHITACKLSITGMQHSNTQSYTEIFPNPTRPDPSRSTTTNVKEKHADLHKLGEGLLHHLLVSQSIRAQDQVECSLWVWLSIQHSNHGLHGILHNKSVS